MARHFDNIAKFLRFGENSPTTFPIRSYPFTISIRVKPNAVQTGQALIMLPDSVANVRFGLSVTDSSGLKATVNARNTGDVILNGTTNLSTNGDRWYSIIGVFRGNTDRELFLDGASEAIGTGNAPFNTNVDRLSIGRYDRASPIQSFPGDISECAIYNTELTDGEIKGLADGVDPRTIRGGNLVFYCPLEGRNSPEPDLSSRHNEMEIFGEPIGVTHPLIRKLREIPRRLFLREEEAVTFTPRLMSY